MFEKSFKNIDNILYKDSGADSELDYIGQTSWNLFMTNLDEAQLSQLLILKNHALTDAKHALGDIPSIRKTFIGFQEHLYERGAV